MKKAKYFRSSAISDTDPTSSGGRQVEPTLQRTGVVTIDGVSLSCAGQLPAQEIGNVSVSYSQFGNTGITDFFLDFVTSITINSDGFIDAFTVLINPANQSLFDAAEALATCDGPEVMAVLDAVVADTPAATAGADVLQEDIVCHTGRIHYMRPAYVPSHE